MADYMRTCGANDKNTYRANIAVIDTGYTKLCMTCNKRYAEQPTVIGTPRDLITITRCNECIQKGKRIFDFG